ncbi:endo alpha-1,4 polygalactosaminidase [Ruficoccus amylovorans]|uniref:Endo alpha-1,4 polygalactosaminidase n=1 Tax=Ruficoccus amylovorans TaxID=1804625 RepID=A0A842HA42_9BACT|nr:endo alpha-1,4 polygalactosaminidase [Ruficoccus amylovorans]MBC2593170.1 endo alpha-1,4 polygalactosaminidase [Ruficoccus amylovorans]
MILLSRYFAGAVLAATISHACGADVSGARDAFRKIDSYACYYGEGKLDELRTRDAVVIETRNQSLENIHRLQEGGTLVIGYISIGEDDDLRVGDGKGPGGKDSSYFDRDGDGQPDRNGIWDSYYADSRQPAWREHFMKNIARMKAVHHVDGFFLDTVDTSELYPESEEAMVSLIRELRSAYPDSLIVLNRGFHTVEALAPVIDGVMFESFTASYDWPSSSYLLLTPSSWDYGLEVWQEALKPAMDNYGVVVLALDYAPSADSELVKTAMDRAATFGFIPEVSTIYLDDIYEIDYQPQKNPDYLTVQCTPERLAYELTEAANGFPAGTRVMPSSSYPDYEVKAVVDGVADKDTLGWRHRAWASQETDEDHWLEFILPQPIRADGLAIDWAWDNGTAYAARNFRIEVKPQESEDWVLVSEYSENEQARNAVRFAPVKVAAVRVVQEEGGGSTGRPDLMWVEKVALSAVN